MEMEQEGVQVREAANTNKDDDLNEDGSLDLKPEPYPMSETNKKEKGNAEGCIFEKLPDQILENVQDDDTCDNIPDTDIAKEKGCGEGISDENFKKRISKCDPCLFDEIEENANAFCVVCVEYLCKKCARDHKKSKATRNHRVLLDDEIPNDPELFKMMKSLACCSEHPEMEVSFKCRKPEKFICTKCLIVSHMKCEDVSEASKVNRSFIGDETESSLSDMLKEIHGMTVSVRVVKEENIEKLHLDQASIQEERSEFIKSLHEHLVNLDKNSKTEMEDILKKELDALTEEVNKCKDIEKEEMKYEELLCVAMKHGNIIELNVISTLVKKEADTLKDKTKKLEAKAAVRLKFKKNKSFTDGATIGSVFVIRGDEKGCNQDENTRKKILLENSSDVIDETSSDVGGISHKEPLMQSSVSRTRTMHDLRQAGCGARYKCSVTSMLVLENGRVVVTDHFNERIKLLNLDLSVKMEYDIDGKPIDMCQTSRGHLVVICDGKKMIKRYIALEHKILSDGGFPSKLYPVSIEKSNENDSHLIILFSDEQRNTPKRSDNDTIEIQIRSLHNGAVIQQLTDFKTKQLKEMILENPSRIREMPKVKNAILLSEIKKLHCFDIDQTSTNTIKERWYYKSHTSSVIDDITDIAVDNEGNIYVCGKSSKNIHQISGSNFMNNRVLFSVHGAPISICVDDERRRLLVGCENDDFIYVVTLD